MRKKLFLVFIVILFMHSACTPSELPEVLPGPMPSEPVLPVKGEEILSNDTPAERLRSETVSNLPEEKTQDTFELIYPSLTYDNAYNGPLYATSEQIGNEAPLDKHFQNMDRNGVTYMIAFFSIELDPEEEEDLDIAYVKNSIRKYPKRIIPFFSPGMSSEETKPFLGDKLTTMYKDTMAAIKQKVGSDFIQGFGEIEQYAWNIQPNEPKLLQLYDVAKENDLAVMFHPAVGQSAGVKALIEKYPGTTFLIHMFPEDFDKDRQKYVDLLKTHENLYFSVDVDHMMFDGNTGLLYKYEDLPVAQAKTKFIVDYNKNEQILLTSALNRYKPLIEAVPDKVMWGTEGGTDYVYEAEVYDLMIKFTRLFIGKLNLDYQEKLAYKNALRVFGEGVVLE